VDLCIFAETFVSMCIQKILSDAAQKPRIFGLDVVRTVAILSVVVAHSAAIFPNMNAEYRNIFRYGFGFLGVELFFVLSGFLVGGILLRGFQSVDNYRFTHILPFWQRRWRRTLPNYFCFLLLAMAHALFIKHHFQLDVRYFFFLQNFATPIPDFYDITWSLSIEEWFYLLFPITLLIATSISKMSPKSSFALVGVVWIVGGFLLRIFLPNTEQGWDESVRKVVLLRLDAIPYGVLAAFLWHFYRDKLLLLRQPMILSSLLTFLLSLLLLWRVEVMQLKNTPLLFALTDFSFAIWVFYAANWTAPKRQNSISRWVTLTSICAYSMYLIHPWTIILVNKIQEKVSFDYPFLAYLLFLGLTYAWSMGQFFYFEKRWL
jgi:peptidoglycan/LPS O-acetylase OafA/YrhL